MSEAASESGSLGATQNTEVEEGLSGPGHGRVAGE